MPLIPLPKQKISETSKDDKWKEECIIALVGRAGSSVAGNRSSRLNKQVNYDLFNSILNLDDFSYITKPYGEKFHDVYGKMPANFQDYNIVRDSVLQLVGEELKRPFLYKAISTAGEGRNMYLQDREEALQNSYLALLQKARGEQAEAQTPEQIDDYFTNSYSNHIEITANKLLRHLEYSQRLQNIFIKGFHHALIAAEEIYFVDIFNNEPKLIPWNPINFECDKNQDAEFIEDTDWAVGRLWLDKGQILDFLGDRLSTKQKDMMDQDTVYQATGAYNQSPGVISFSEPDFNTVGSKILVSLCSWKSYKKVGFVTYFNDKGIKQTTMVDEDFEEPENSDLQIEWEWIPRTWIGFQIGPEIFVAYEREIQFNSIDNPYRCKLAFMGRVYNNLNSYPTSLVELIKPYQYFYNVTWWRLEQQLAKAKGKKFVMDVALIPKSKGWTTEQWMYYFDTLDVAWINSLEEGRPGDSDSITKFNQITGVDMSLTTAIQGFFNTLQKIEERVEAITGINRQRKGSTQASETATGVETAVVQSTALTEIYFHEHNLVKEKALEYLLEVAKVAYKNNEQGKLVFDEFTRQILNTQVLLNTDFGIYISNSIRDNAILNELKNAAREALSSGAINFSGFITTVKTQSIAEIENQIKKAEQAKHQLEEQQNSIEQSRVDLEREKLDREDRNKQLDRENKLAVAEIQQLRGKDGPSDLNQNNIPDALEMGKFALEQSRESFNQQKESNKLSLEVNKLKLQNEQFIREQSQQDAKNKQDAIFKAEELKLKKEKLQIDRKALKYKKTPNTPKKK